MKNNLRAAIAAMLALLVTASPMLAAAEVATGVGETVEAPASEQTEILSGSVTSSTLSELLLRAKSIIGDTDDYTEFEHYYEEYGSYAIYELYWRGSDKREDLSITVGSDGTIYSYYQHGSYRQSNIVIPEISKAEAIELAVDFILKLDPQFEEWISPEFATVSYNRYGYYTVRIDRSANGYLIADEYIRVYITPDGRVYRMNAQSMMPGLEYPSEPKLADTAKITNAFSKAIPFTLGYYSYRLDGDNTDSDEEPMYEIRLRYSPSSDCFSTVVDAASGRVYKVDYSDGLEAAMGGGMQYGDEAVVEEETAAADTMLNSKDSLSSAESSAVELQDSFISVAEAVEAVKAMSGFELSDSLTVACNSLTSTRSSFTGKLSYFHKLTLTDGNGNSGSATVNAETGEVTIFNVNSSDTIAYKAVSEHTYTDAQCLEAAEEFLKANYADKYGEYRLKDSSRERTYAADRRISQYSYSYTRYINDVPYSSDSINISVNPETLKVTYLSLKYSDATFPSPEGVITADEAFEAYMSELSPAPSYVVTSKLEKDTIYIYDGYMPNGTDVSLTPVYAIEDYAFVDAFDGSLLHSNGKPYVPSASSYFSETRFEDIDDSPYKLAIEKLADMDMLEATSKFAPNDAVTVGEFTEMLYYIGSTSPIENEVDVKLTRERAITLLIDSLGYGEVAKLKGIFKCDFADADSISDDDLGYVAIAQGLGLLELFGDSFNADAILTRGEAAQLIYSCLLARK